MLRREEKPVTTTRLLPVVLSAETARALQPRPEPIAITVRDDVALRVPVGSDVSYVAALVAAVRKTC